jgi:acyl-coenzyme A synthetase/AMP-(fatty) acid ligase
MPTLPLIAHVSPDAVVAWRSGEPVAASEFLGEVAAVAALLPPGRHVLNLCSDRYRFAVTLLACVVSARVSLLPSTHTPEMVGQMRRLAPDLFCIHDRTECAIDLPLFRYPENLTGTRLSADLPEIDCEQVVAQVFTSGSTGLPQPHLKRWGSLVRNVQAEAARLGIDNRHGLVGTVPAQHMYGLESTVLMPLLNGAALHNGHPFYPADVVAALDDLPRPRVLVTTPYHLRALLDAGVTLPAADLLLSATAPLSPQLAVRAETAFGAALHEIYGCTETGQLATRQTTHGPVWKTLDGVRLRHRDEAAWAEGGHVDTPTRLNDRVELLDGDPTRFLLHGRHADLVNIAGKRTSLSYLNHQLNAIPGVRDGVFLLPQENENDPGDAEGVRRLAALVVAPDLTPALLMQALRERIDAIFLPRPLLFVDALPRNATGKLPGQAVRSMLAELGVASDRVTA